MALAFGASVACATSSSTTAQVPPGAAIKAGVWGGDRVGVTVTDRGAQVEFDCARGELPGPLKVDAAGRASVDGVFVQERGGPVRVGQDPPRQPAKYDIHLSADAMTLTVTLDGSAAALGTFSLKHGTAPRLKKCR